MNKAYKGEGDWLPIRTQVERAQAEIIQKVKILEVKVQEVKAQEVKVHIILRRNRMKP